MTPDENTVASFTGDGGVSEHLAEKTMFPDKFGSLLGLLQSTAKSMARKGRRGTSHLGESCDRSDSPSASRHHERRQAYMVLAGGSWGLELRQWGSHALSVVR